MKIAISQDFLAFHEFILPRMKKKIKKHPQKTKEQHDEQQVDTNAGKNGPAEGSKNNDASTNDDDDDDKKKEWNNVEEINLAWKRMWSNKNFDMKWINKNMPTAVKALQEGWMSSSTLHLIVFFRSISKSEDPKSVQKESYELLLEALPMRFNQYSLLDEDEFTDLILDVREDLLNELVSKKIGKGLFVVTSIDSHPVTLSDYKEAIDETCRMWSDRIDAMLFRGKKGIFLRKCPIYNKPKRIFETLLGENNNRELNSNVICYYSTIGKQKREQFTRALNGIKNECFEVHKKCWECSSKCSTISHCSGCKAAVYCSRECQGKHVERLYNIRSTNYVYCSMKSSYCLIPHIFPFFIQ